MWPPRVVDYSIQTRRDGDHLQLNIIAERLLGLPRDP